MKSAYDRIFSVCILIFAALCGIAGADPKHPYSVEDELAIKTITDVRISPDGKWVAYVEQHPDMKEDRPINLIYQIEVGGRSDSADHHRQQFTEMEPRQSVSRVLVRTERLHAGLFAQPWRWRGNAIDRGQTRRQRF